MLENTEIYSAFNKFCNSYSGIYPNSFNNVRFGTKIELLNILFHENLSQIIVKFGRGSGGAVSSATGSWQSPGGG